MRSNPAPAPAHLLRYLARRDIGCPQCGYNLRALTAETCPECGEAVSVARLIAARPPTIRDRVFGMQGWSALAFLFGCVVVASFARAGFWAMHGEGWNLGPSVLHASAIVLAMAWWARAFAATAREQIVPFDRARRPGLVVIAVLIVGLGARVALYLLAG